MLGKTGIAARNGTVFIITLRPLPGVDGLRGLRRLLRYALRACGLRCTNITTME